MDLAVGGWVGAEILLVNSFLPYLGLADLHGGPSRTVPSPSVTGSWVFEIVFVNYLLIKSITSFILCNVCMFYYSITFLIFILRTG